jgi:hypothetical protein
MSCTVSYIEHAFVEAICTVFSLAALLIIAVIVGTLLEEWHRARNRSKRR